MADTTLYKQIVLEWGQDTDSLIWGMGYSPDNGEHFYVLNTTYGRKYRTEDGDRIWPFIVDKVKAALDWSNITNKPDLALKTDLTWSNVTGKPDVALKSDVAAVSAVASNASAKADSNAKLIADKASQEDLNNVSSTASSALDKATSNANALASKVNKSDLTWTNITNRPDVDSIASQASQAVVTANTAESQASAAGQAAASATAQASAAKTTADTATATANAAKASASTASATAASAQQVANSASASASATAVALKSKADTATVNTQFTAVNSNVASAQATADSAVAGLAGKLDKTALTWGNVSGKPTNLATTESVAKAQSAADSAVSVANGAVTTANSAKSTATSAVGVANTANTTANSALAKANSAATVANQASQSASNAVSVANQAKSTAESASTTATQAKSTADSANNNASSAVNTANQANSNASQAVTTANSANNKVIAIQTNGGGRNLLIGSDPTLSNRPGLGGVTEANIDGIKAWESHNADNIFFGSILDANTTYTYSALIKVDDAGELGFLRYGHFQVCNPNAHNQVDPTHEDIPEKRDYHGINVPANQWTRIYYTFTTNDLVGSSFGVFPSHANGHVYIRHLMLEKGTIAHDWQPAPEDTNSQIDANKTSANNAQNTANKALSKANSNAAVLNNKANKSDLTWANISGKPSIPNADDTTTVSSGDLNNYTTTGKYYMPNGLSQYTNHPTTGIDMGNRFVMKVDAYHSGDMIVQTIYQINSGDVWIRQRWSGAWKSWRQINFWG